MHLTYFCDFHTTLKYLDSTTTFKQFKFQKFFAELDNFIKKINFSITFYNNLITLLTLSFIIILLFSKQLDVK